MELKSDQSPKVQLGCGTLILIALIVMIFSGRGQQTALQETVQQLNSKLDRLEQKIDALTAASATPQKTPEP